MKDTVLEFSWMNWGQQRKSLVSIGGALAEIWIGHFLMQARNIAAYAKVIGLGSEIGVVVNGRLFI
jgi:hypothetical protein